MDTPSTRKVTDWTVTPVAVVGLALRTTMRLRVVAGMLTVMADPVAVVVPVPVVPVPVVPVPVVPVPVVPVPVVPVPVVPVPVVPVPVVPVPVVPVPVVPVPVVVVPVPVVVVPVLVVVVPVVDAVVAVLGVVVMPSLPQPAKAMDRAAIVHRSLPLNMIPLKVSYIALLPKAINAAVQWSRRR